MQYTIVESFHTDKLIDKVNSMVAEGWEPFSGPLVIPSHSPTYGPIIAQAMIRRFPPRLDSSV